MSFFLASDNELTDEEDLGFLENLFTLSNLTIELSNPSLAYKLGSAFMKGYKSWYKGGLVKFCFEAKASEREFKSKKAKQE